MSLDLDGLFQEGVEEGRREAREWQPIETAPKDGTSVLVAHDDTIVSEATFDTQDDNWWLAQTGPHDFDPSNAIYPTHWMPMPPHPNCP